MNVPILIKHRHDLPPIGFVTANENGFITVEFAQDLKITRQMFFEIFGNIGFRILEQGKEGDVITICKAEILEFSLGE